MQQWDRSEKDETVKPGAHASMEHEEQSANAVPMSQRLRLRLLQEDYNNQPALLPRATVERTEGAGTSSESRMDLPDDDCRRFPQARISKDDELVVSNRPYEVTYHAELLRTNNLRKWQQEDLDDSEDNSEEAQDTPDVNTRSVAEIIYAENRKKARLAHAVIDKLGPTVTEPLYQEPSDTAAFHEHKRKYLEFKKTLVQYLKRKAQGRQATADPSSGTCSELIEARPNETGGKDHSAERNAKIQEWLQILEEKFPELKNKRQEQVIGLAKACCQRKRRGADMQLILGVQKQDNEERRKRNCAVLPPFRAIELRPSSPVSFQNLVQDPLVDLKERCLTNEWNDEEKKVFREKFIQHPKEFGLIASYLDRKSVADCVHYYYLTKKRENYKQLMR